VSFSTLKHIEQLAILITSAVLTKEKENEEKNMVLYPVQNLQKLHPKSLNFESKRQFSVS
jgi:hypothetical protein